MSVPQQIFSGFSCLLSGFSLLTHPRLRLYVIMPVGINILVFGLLFWLAASRFSAFVDSLLPALPGWLSWLGNLLWLLFALMAIIILFFSFTLLANLIASPFNSLLAGATEHLLSGSPLPASGGMLPILAEVVRTVFSELRKLGYFIFWAIPLGLLFLIPLINMTAPMLWALFSAWMMALQYLDYPMANHGLHFKKQRHFLRRRRLLGIGFGGSVMLATLIPLLNLVVMPAAVIGATRLWVENREETTP